MNMTGVNVFSLRPKIARALTKANARNTAAMKPSACIKEAAGGAPNKPKNAGAKNAEHRIHPLRLLWQHTFF